VSEFSLWIRNYNGYGMREFVVVVVATENKQHDGHSSSYYICANLIPVSSQVSWQWKKNRKWSS